MGHLSRQIAALALVLATACETDATQRCVGAECLDGPPCATDAECDDGRVCNGVELCGTVSRRCVDGIPLDCDDGIECTDDICGEPDGSCTSVANQGRCAGGQRCTEDHGCISSCPSSVLCDPVLACGCPAGEACTYPAGGSPTCAPAGVLEHGTACTRRNECVAGAQCIPLDGSDVLPGEHAECRAFCDSDARCPDGSTCSVRLVGTTARMCTRSCDLVTQLGCAAGTGCHPVAWPGPDAYADCVVLGDRAEGDPCGFAGAVCRAGLICVTQSESFAICDRMCRTSSHCSGTQRCVQLVEPIVVDGVAYGVCN